MNSSEQRDPHDEDRYLARKLIEHLNSNIEHYNKVLWTQLDPDRRYMLLDGFNIDVYNDFGVPQPARSLASVVKNQLLGISGNSIIFPVAAGYRVSQSYLSEVDEEGETERVLDHGPLSAGGAGAPVPHQCAVRRGVPRSGAGRVRRLRAREGELVTGLGTLPYRRANRAPAGRHAHADRHRLEGRVRAFAPPLVNIQNAPALPALGEGLGGITELLGKAGIFNDITGLGATQQNAMRTYLSNQENTKAFAEMAKGMAMQSHNTEHSDKIMETLDSAKTKGALNDEEYGTLVKAHAQQQIDGGAAAGAEADRDERRATPSSIRSAVQLSQEGAGSVKATESDAEGNLKSLEVVIEAEATKHDVSIPGTLDHCARTRRWRAGRPSPR